MKLGIRLGFLIQWLVRGQDGFSQLMYNRHPSEYDKEEADEFVTWHNSQETEWSTVIIPTEDKNEPNHVATP